MKRQQLTGEQLETANKIKEAILIKDINKKFKKIIKTGIMTEDNLNKLEKSDELLDKIDGIEESEERQKIYKQAIKMLDEIIKEGR